MAYGLKYFSEFSDVEEIGYRVEIHERDYSGDSLEIVSSGSPFVLEVMDVDNIFAPIRTKKATIEWTVTDDTDFEIKDLELNDDQRYKVFFYEIKEGDVLVNKFTGYLVTVDCKEPFGSKPYHIQLSAACGLFFLRDYYFTSDGGEFVLDKINIKNTIGQCLQFANLELDFHTYVDLYDIQMASSSEDPLALADFSADGLRGLTCYDALSGVLNAINAFVVQEGDVWVIKGIPDSAALECPRRIYDFQSVFKSSGIVNQAVSIGREPFNGTIPNLIPTEAVTTSIAETSSVIKNTVSPGIAVNRLRNGQFAYPIVGSNMTGWNIDLDDMRYPSGGLESKGWERSGFGTIDDPYRFVMRGTVRPGNKNDYGINLSTIDPITIDAGLFDKNQKVKIVVSGAFRSRDIMQMDIACRLNDGDRDYVDWLDVSGKWHQEKKARTHIINKVDSNEVTDITIPVGDLPLQTFEVKSEIITNYLNRNVGGLPHSIAKLYFSVYPGVEIPKNPGKAPLLALEDFAVSITTETIYEGEHTYVVDADLPIRNANEINYTSIVADKINIITPEQVRLENRVMTGYITIHNTENLTYGWKRRIGGLADPTGDSFLPIQFKVIKERIRQVCGKRIVVEGDFLGYDLNASNSVFLQYDDVYNEDKFYTITNWKWDVINRRYTVKLNELSLVPLTTGQEFVELNKDGSGNRGNRLYGGASGSNSFSNGGGSPDIPDPIVLDPFDPLYFVVDETTTQTFDVGALITSGQLPEDVTALIAYYPSWMLAPYEDRGVDGDLLTFTVTGTPTEVGHEQILIELTDVNNTKALVVVPIIMQPKTTNVNQVLDGTTLDILGVVPGFFPLPDLFNFRSKIVGTHDKIEITVIGGGVSGGSLNETTTREVELTDAANYLLFDDIDGVVVEAGVYNYEVVTYRGTLETSREEGSFTLYDEEYLAKASFELYDTTKDELIGIITIDGDNQYKKPESFDVKTIISELNHDKINFTLNKDGVEVYSVEYLADPAVTDAEYFLFGSIVTTYGSGKYDLLVDVSLLGAAVYQRLSSFEILDEEVQPEAGIDLIEFKENTINYTIVASLPLFNYQADLPINWGLEIPVPAVDYDYAEWKLYDSTSGGLVEVDIETYTNLPPYKSFSGDPEPILVFGLKDSTDIGDIHRAPSSFRLKAIFKLGGVNGDVVSIKQADFSFRVPLEPEDYSGNRFIQINDSDSSFSIIDANMPKTGSKYIFPDEGVRWSVSTRSFNSELFDKIVIKLSKLAGGSYVVLHKDGTGYISEFNSATDIIETPTELSACITGILGGDNLRYLYDPSLASIIIDEIGSYKASFDYYLDSVLIGTSETEFDLIDKSIPEIPIKDCCGGDGTELPVYPVEGVWGGDNKLLQITFTENGTASNVEELDLDGVSISDDVWEFTYPPRSATAASVNDELVNYGQLIEAVAAGSADKEPVKTVSTSNITLSGNQIINGYNTVTGDRVLVTNQTDPKQNGSYVAVAGAWGRSLDADTGAELVGATYLVTDGDATVIGTRWKVTNTPPIVIGTDNINIVKIQGAETDPTVGAWIKAITAAQITNWDTAYTGYTNFNSMFDTRFGIKTTNNLAEGTINKYFTEQRVRDTTLTGLTFVNAFINQFDTVLSAFGKVQAQIDASTANLFLYVRKDVGAVITADHQFTNTNLKLSSIYYHNLFSTSNTAYVHYYPSGGNGASNSFVNLRVWDASAGTQRTLSFGGDNSFTWGGISVVLANRTISTGTGLLGGGDLTANRTITVNFGVSAGTVAEGNHTHTFASITSKPTTLAGYGITDAAASADLSGYVQRATANTISAAHNFTGAIIMPGVSSSNTFDGTNIYRNYLPVGGNGAVITKANLRVWDGAGGYKALILGGDGTLTWISTAIVLATRAINTGTGLLGGGDLTINRTLSVNFGIVAGTVSEGNHTHTFASLTSKPTTLAGYGITDAASSSSLAGYVPITRLVSTGTGILGGGALSADRTLTFDTTWGDARYTTAAFVTSQGYITASSTNNLTNKTGLISMWSNDAGFVTTDTLATTLGNFVRRDIATTITASHIFTGLDLTMPGIHYHAMFSTTNTAFVNYYPVGGNGSNNSFVQLRVWDAVGGTAKSLTLGGNGTLVWNGVNVSLVGHTHTASQITDFTTAGRALISGTGSISYNSTTGVISYTGGAGIGTVTSVSMSVPTGLSISGSPITSSGTLALSYTSGYSIPTNSKQTSWDVSANRWISGTEVADMNSVNDSGLKSFGVSTVNTPDTYGTVLSMIGNSLDGNSASSGFHNQLAFSAGANIYFRQKIFTSGTYTTWQRFWTTLQFTQTDVTNWNTAFSWGNPTSFGYITASSTNTLTNKSGNITMWTNNAGYLTGITSAQIISALGYTPYNSTNPNGYITASSSNNLINKTGYISMWANDAGYINSLNFSMIVTALGYTPYNSTNPSGFITGINSSMVTSALGYTPYNSSNPSGYISGINSSMVTSALGYTPIPNNRTITINGNTQNLNDSPNFTLSTGTVSGSGTTNYITKWTGGTSVGNSRMQDTGSGEIQMNAGISATHAYINNTITAGSGQISGGFTAGYIYALSGFALPASTEAALPASPPEGTLQYVNTGSGKGLWCYMGSSGWRIMATRAWVGASNPGSSPP